jgi:hypothetical protein
MEPAAPKVPATPEIVTLAAFGTFQLRVELPPGLTEVGDALKLEPAAVGHDATVTVVCSWIEEQVPAPAAVKVYVVVADGETETLPVAANVPATPEIVTLVAFGTFHERVELPPGTIEEGEAEKDEPATAGHDPTVTVVCSVTGEQLPGPEAVSV